MALFPPRNKQLRSHYHTRFNFFKDGLVPWHIDKRFFSYFDFLGLILMLILMAIGLLFVFSATYKIDQPYSLFFKKQLFGVVTGLGIYMIFCIIDYRKLNRWGYFIYFAIIGLLLLTLIKGSIGMGAQRWINFGFIKFQPSELTKLFFPAFLSYYLYTEKQPPSSPAALMPIISMLLVSILLIRKQPDLSTALILLFSGMLLIWLAGIGTRFFAWVMVLVLCIMPIAWHHLHDYQKQRILVFLGEGNNRKEKYQSEQSQIAIGSGGLTGKGFLKGTQNKLQFLPESRTDFIFSVLGEEWGFIGTLGLIILYLVLFARLIRIIVSIKNIYAQLLATGLVLHIILSTIINIGMVIGLLPIAGIPLPFISYGVSNLWISCASLGWFNSIACRRFYLSSSRPSDDIL
jgi:rod shape determining protein RodA